MDIQSPPPLDVKNFASASFTNFYYIYYNWPLKVIYNDMKPDVYVNFHANMGLKVTPDWIVKCYTVIFANSLANLK